MFIGGSYYCCLVGFPPTEVFLEGGVLYAL